MWRRILALWMAFLLICLPTITLADSLSISAWSSGDALNSTNLNSRMTTISTWANGSITNINISGTAAIAGSKLDLTSAAGRISHSSSVTSDAPVFTSGQTWDNVAGVFSLWRGTVTNTNSASTSRLIDLRVGSTIIASISRVGQLMLAPQDYASGPSTMLEGAWFNVASATYTDNMTAASGTAPRFIAYAFQRPALGAANTSVTTTDAATVFIASAPVTSTNMTITNRYALWVDQGDVRLGGNLAVRGVAYTWPAADGAASTFLQTNGAGTLSWTANALPSVQFLGVGIGDGVDSTYSANKVYLFPVYTEAALTVTKVRVYVAVQSGNIDVGIYNTLGAKVVSSGSTAVGGVGTQNVAIASTVLTAGTRYFVAIALDNATASLRTANTQGTPYSNSISASFPLPASVAEPAAGDGAVEQRPGFWLY